MECPECNKEISEKTIGISIPFSNLNRPKILIICKLPCGFILNNLLDFSQTF